MMKGQMQIPTGTTNCCGCISPRTGISVLGTISIIGSAIYIVMIMTVDDSSLGGKPLSAALLKYVQFLVVGFHITNIVIRAALVIGVKQDKPMLMFPAICTDFAGIVLGVPITFTIFAIPATWVMTFVLFFILLVALLLSVHFFAVEYFYYEHLRFQNWENSLAQVKYDPSNV